MPLDIAFGIMGAAIAAPLIGIPLTGGLIVLCILFALSPDADYLIYLARTRASNEFAHEHRDLLHNPIIFIGICGAMLSAISVKIAALFAALALLHFLHDSVGVGWGVRWAYPFSKKYFKFFHNGKSITSWTPAEQKEMARSHGDPQWLAHYFKSREFYLELAVFCVAVVIALLFFF